LTSSGSASASVGSPQPFHPTALAVLASFVTVLLLMSRSTISGRRRGPHPARGVRRVHLDRDRPRPTAQPSHLGIAGGPTFTRVAALIHPAIQAIGLGALTGARPLALVAAAIVATAVLIPTRATRRAAALLPRRAPPITRAAHRHRSPAGAARGARLPITHCVQRSHIRRVRRRRWRRCCSSSRANGGSISWLCAQGPCPTVLSSRELATALNGIPAPYPARPSVALLAS